MSENMDRVIARLEHIEDKLSELNKVMINMARTEERVTIILEQLSTIFKQNAEAQKERALLKEEINKLKTENATQGQSLGFFERIGWIVASAIIGGIGWLSNK